MSMESKIGKMYLRTGGNWVAVYEEDGNPALAKVTRCDNGTTMIEAVTKNAKVLIRKEAMRMECQR